MELYKVVIVNFAILFSCANLTAAHSLSFYRIGAFEPIHHINIMNVLLGDVIATQPVEIIPIAHLVFHLGLTGLAHLYPNAIIIPPGLAGGNVSDHAILHTLK